MENAVVKQIYLVIPRKTIMHPVKYLDFRISYLPAKEMVVKIKMNIRVISGSIFIQLKEGK